MAAYGKLLLLNSCLWDGPNSVYSDKKPPSGRSLWSLQSHSKHSRLADLHHSCEPNQNIRPVSSSLESVYPVRFSFIRFYWFDISTDIYRNYSSSVLLFFKSLYSHTHRFCTHLSYITPGKNLTLNAKFYLHGNDEFNLSPHYVMLSAPHMFNSRNTMVIAWFCFPFVGIVKSNDPKWQILHVKKCTLSGHSHHAENKLTRSQGGAVTH